MGREHEKREDLAWLRRLRSSVAGRAADGDRTAAIAVVAVDSLIADYEDDGCGDC